MPKANLIHIKKTTGSGLAISHLLIPNLQRPETESWSFQNLTPKLELGS
jgi:hypothetical protein